MAGLSAIVATSARVFTVVKLAGAAYLIYLGIKALRAASAALEPAATAPHRQPLRRIFRDAVIINVLNPKTAVFFLAFVPQFVDPAAGNATSQLLVLSAVFVGLGLTSDGLFALAGASIGRLLVASPRAQRRTNTAAGATYIGLGVVTATTGTN